MQAELIKKIEEVLNRQRAKTDLCDCDNCQRIQNSTVYDCDSCGYKGKPVTAACACYEYGCSGGDARGSGCWHGVAFCPACDDGEEVASIVREVREVLRASVAI